MAYKNAINILTQLSLEALPTKLGRISNPSHKNSEFGQQCQIRIGGQI